jgi:predicted secreted protein
MAKLLGNNYRLWVETATAGTYAYIKGQKGMSNARSANTIDTSTKDDGVYGTSTSGQFDWTLTLAGIPDLPDATGLTFVDSKYKAQVPWKFQIRKGGQAGTTTDAVFEGLCNIADLSIDYGDNAPVGYSLKLTLAAAPTTDLLS